MDIGDLASVVALIISAFALWRTRSSLSIYRDSDDGITVTNNSPHAVTLIEIGLIDSDGRLDEGAWRPDDNNMGLPYRLDAHHTVMFRPSLDTTILRAQKAMISGRDGTYVRMASGQLFGNKGRAFSDIGFLRWNLWKVLSTLRKCKRKKDSNE